MGVKWGLDEPLTYWKALELLEDVDLKKGRALNWGGLRLFLKPASIDSIAFPVIKRGCVELVKLHVHSVTLNRCVNGIAMA